MYSSLLSFVFTRKVAAVAVSKMKLLLIRFLSSGASPGQIEKRQITGLARLMLDRHVGRSRFDVGGQAPHDVPHFRQYENP
ncbi:MAG: hypothetical protein DMF03_00550 [Verrucomicrobia bacterium]|nr:MAG: hypothetical protein DMF03_00550 [Verrucomicrobiota bacterium]